MRLIVSGGDPMFNAVTQGNLPATKAVAGSIRALSAGYRVARFAGDCSFDTGVVTGAAHSGALLVRHRNLLSGSSETYFGSRVSNNHGFLFFMQTASGTAPNRMLTLGYVHGGVAVATESSNVSGGDDQFIVVGFSAIPSTGVVNYYANGLPVGSASNAGTMTTTTDTVRIGRDIHFNQNDAKYDLAAATYGNVFLTAEEHRELARNMWQLFAPAPVPRLISLPIGPFVYARPTADVSLGNWVGV